MFAPTYLIIILLIFFFISAMTSPLTYTRSTRISKHYTTNFFKSINKSVSFYSISYHFRARCNCKLRFYF